MHTTLTPIGYQFRQSNLKNQRVGNFNLDEFLQKIGRATSTVEIMNHIHDLPDTLPQKILDANSQFNTTLELAEAIIKKETTLRLPSDEA